ncbi:hypothetical protein D9M71_360100 [compost metagenome]
MLDRTAGQAVAFTQRAVDIDHEFRHQEQRNAFGAWRSIRQSGQHQVNDVFGEVVLTAGDEDLGAADLVAAISLWLGLGANNAQVGSRVRLGQAHGTGPDTGVHVRQVLFLELVAGVGVDRQTGASGQHRIQTEGQARRVDHFLDLGRDHLGHAHAAVGRIAADADPAAFGVGLVGVDKTGRSAHGAVIPVATFFIAAAAQRRDALAGDLAGFFQHRQGGVFVHRFGKAGQLRPELGDFEDFIEDEAHIAQGRFIVSHGNLSHLCRGRSRRTASLLCKQCNRTTFARHRVIW